MAITGASLQPIYDRLHAVHGYHPMSADTFADWSVEAGDIVTMKRDNTPLATPIHNAKIVWRGSPQVTLNSTGNEERESISRVSRRKYGRGGGMTNDQRIYRDMWSEDGHLHSELEITESVLRTEYSAADSRLQSEFEITASHLRTEFTDADNHLQSEIEVTASRLRTEFTDADNHLQGEIEVTASRLRTEYTDADAALRGELEVTASHLRSDYEAADGRLEGELEMTASHLRTEFTDSDERLKSEFEITASHLQTEFQDADARLASEMEITASHMRTEYTDGINSVHSEVVQTASSWNAKISGVVDSEGNVTAASIAIAINASMGESEAIIDAQKVYIGNQKSTTVINGKCSLSDVSADYIKGQIATLGRLFCSEMEGNMYGHNLLFASGLTPYGTTVYTNVKSLIKAVQIAGPTSNTYKLQYQTYNDDSETWHDAGSFSRATSLSGAWSSGTLTVTASPQGDTFVRTIIQDTAHADWGDGYVSVPILSQWTSGASTYTEDTGQDVYISFGSKLQAKTVTANGTVYPDFNDGYIGLSSVDVQVPAPSVTPVISYAWSSSGQLTVSTTPAAQEDLVRRLNQGTVTWNGNTASVPIIARYGSQDQYSEATNFNATVDATSRYTAGQNAVTLNNPSWSNGSPYTSGATNTVTVSTSGRPTQLSKDIPVTLVQNAWNNNNSKTVDIQTTNGVIVARITVDASTIYNNGVTAGTTAGKNAVSINKGSWSNGQVQFTKSEGTESTKGVKVGLSGSWSGNSYNYTINDYYDISQGVSTGYTGSIDASSIRTAGKNDVTLNNPSWSNGSPYTSGATNTATVSTSGRPTQLSKTVPVTLVQNAWSGNSKTVDIQTTNGVIVARITVDASSIRTAGQNDVTLNDASWNSVASITASRMVTVSTSGRPTQLSKSKTVHLTVGSWVSGSIPIYIRDGSTSGTIVAQNSVSIPSVSSTTWTNTSGRTWRADLSIGGATRSSSTKDFQGYYNDGWNTCRGYCSVPVSGSADYVRIEQPSSTVDGTKEIIDYTINITNTTVQIMWGNSQVAVKSHTKYQDGYNTGYSSGYSSGYSTGKAEGQETGVNSINYLTCDAGLNRYGDNYNFNAYTHKGGTLVRAFAGASPAAGFYFPMHDSYSITANGTYTPESGYNGFRSVVVNVPQKTHSGVIVFVSHSYDSNTGVHTYTYRQDINSANPIVGSGSRTVYW